VLQALLNFQGTLGATNYASLCSSLGKGASNIQGIVSGTQVLASWEPTKKKKRQRLKMCLNKNGLPNFLRLNLWWIMQAKLTCYATRFVFWLKARTKFQTLSWMVCKNM
jgi:hypothetical protein